MGMEIEGDGRARISSIRSGSRSRLASCTSWQSRQPEKLHLSLQQYQLLNKAHKTRYASKSSHNIHKTSLKDNSKKAKSDRNVVKGARAARIQQNKCELLDPVVAEATLDFRNLSKRKLLTNFPTFLPQAWLLILYTGLALRENILRVNGSDIRPWWIKHHYFAMAMALISLTWETQKQRGVQLFLQWAIMQGVAMLLQNRYQRQRLCTHIALGKARRMDVVWGETAGVDGQLWLLAPILFILQQRVDTNIANGCDALNLGVAADSVWLFLFAVFGLGFDLVVEDCIPRNGRWNFNKDVLFQVHWLTAMLTNFLFSMARDSM